MNSLKQSRFIVWLRKQFSFLVNKLAPNWAYKKVEDLLLTPKVSQEKITNIPHGIHPFEIETDEGTIHAYKLGHGPAVVLVHGWSTGAYQYFPLMRGLSQIGFKAIAFDHFGHGLSEQKNASLLRFISATNAVLKYVNKTSVDGVGAVVGQSMGCIAVANARPQYIQDVPLLMISPIFDFKQYFIKQMNMLGLHPDLAKQCLAKFEHSYMSGLDAKELHLKLKDYAGDTVIMHDKSDEESSYVDSVKFCSANPLTKLVITRGFDQNRLLNSEAVWQQLKSHLNYEDITLNRFN